MLDMALLQYMSSIIPQRQLCFWTHRCYLCCAYMTVELEDTVISTQLSPTHLSPCQSGAWCLLVHYTQELFTVLLLLKQHLLPCHDLQITQGIHYWWFSIYACKSWLFLHPVSLLFLGFSSGSSAALVSVSHWLAMIHVPCYLFHIILQHFLTWAWSGSFAENLDFCQSLTHWPPGAIQLLLCSTLKGGTRPAWPWAAKRVRLFSSPRHLNTHPALKNRRKNTHRTSMYQTCAVKIILTVTRASFRKVHPRLNTKSSLGTKRGLKRGTEGGKEWQQWNWLAYFLLNEMTWCCKYPPKSWSCFPQGEVLSGELLDLDTIRKARKRN